MEEVVEIAIEWLYTPITWLSARLDQPPDNLLYFATIFWSFAFCLALGQLDSVPVRKFFSSTLGLYLGFYMYGRIFIWNVVFVVVNYLLMRLFPRTLGSNLMTWFSFLCLLGSGFYAKYLKTGVNHAWDIDLAIQINFCKAHMLAVNYDNAGMLDDEKKSKYFTARERYYAEVLR